MIKKLKRTLIVVGMFVLMMGIGTNIQVKADTLGQVKSIKTKNKEEPKCYEYCQSRSD